MTKFEALKEIDKKSALLKKFIKYADSAINAATKERVRFENKLRKLDGLRKTVVTEND